MPDMHSRHLHIHVLQEYGIDFRPHPTSYIRLLRPLTHPSIAEKISLTWGLRYDSRRLDAVIIDRLWRPDVTMELIDEVMMEASKTGTKVIYAIDDDLLSLPANQSGWPSESHREIVKYLLHHCAGVLVTNEILREEFSQFNDRIAVIPNALDERLLVRKQSNDLDIPPSNQRKVIGYMGTRTHLDDLKMISSALLEIGNSFMERIEIQFIGIGEDEELENLLGDLPFRLMTPSNNVEEYPWFMLWFSTQVRWDIALAPLVENSFTRCKSDIKFLDYASIGAAGIFSNTSAYHGNVKHNKTGLLVDNDPNSWINAITNLLENDELRMAIAKNASRYLFQNRVLANSAVTWLESINWILAGP